MTCRSTKEPNQPNQQTQSTKKASGKMRGKCHLINSPSPAIPRCPEHHLQDEHWRQQQGGLKWKCCPWWGCGSVTSALWVSVRASYKTAMLLAAIKSDALSQGSPASGIYYLMICGRADIITEIKCTINVMHLNHSETIPPSLVHERLSSVKPAPGA